MNDMNFLEAWRENSDYKKLLALLASISNIFSESDTPYLSYRAVENIFCRAYNAYNCARGDTAIDAKLGDLGVGIKTFRFDNPSYSIQKVAEFNKLKDELVNLRGIDLANKLSGFRNDRIDFAFGVHNITKSLYHIVGRRPKELCIFNTAYDKINRDSITKVEDTRAGLRFSDGVHEYSYNKSKSVLLQRFYFEQDDNVLTIPVDILDDPYELLLRLSEEPTFKSKGEAKLIGSIVLPLFSTRDGEVQKKSGLNQWNASGRPRNANEVYIPVPSIIHKKYPNFFPGRDTPFDLVLPNGEIIPAKICQENGKALMSNPNELLGKWLLRDALNLPEGVLATKKHLDKYGIDSVQISKYINESKEGSKPYYKLFFEANQYDNYDYFSSIYDDNYL